MDQASSGVIFAVAPSLADEAFVFRCDQGPAKLAAQRKRGRPRGSRKKRKLGDKLDQSNGSQSTDSFEFVNLAGNSRNLDHASRKVIRRQVMLNHIRLKRKAHKETGGCGNLVPQISGVDPFNACPFKLEPYMHDLLKYYITSVWKTLYSIEKHTHCNPMTDYWLPLAFHDGALLHVLIGCAGSYAARLSWFRERPVAVKHLNKAIALVSGRILNDAQVVSDETLVVIATIAMIEKFQRSHNHWNMHMQGLERLVHMRGGLSSLESKPLILSKLYRADLCGSIDAALKPHFASRYLPLPIASLEDAPTLNPGFEHLDTIVGLDDTMKYCINSLCHVISSFKSLTKYSSHADAAKIRFWITSTQYTLLSTEYPDQTHELCRLVLILYSASLVNETPPGASVCDMLIAKLRSTWSNSETTAVKWLPRDFVLWAFFLAASIATADYLREWYVVGILKTAKELDITEWEEVKGMMETFLWELSIQENPCREVWNEAKALELASSHLLDAA